MNARRKLSLVSLALVGAIIGTGCTSAAPKATPAPSESSAVEQLLSHPAASPRTAIVPEWQWVTIQRLAAASQTVPQCGLTAGGTVTEIGQSGSRILVRFKPLANADDVGMPCTGGEVFFLGLKDFSTMTARYNYAVELKNRTQALVARLIKRPASHPAVTTVPASQWVDVLSGFSGKPDLEYGDTCLISEGGQVTEIGRVDYRILVRYKLTDITKSYGKSCAGHEVFFLKLTEFNTMTARYQKAVQKRKNTLALVARLIKNPVAYPAVATVPEWQWASVLRNRRSKRYFINGRTCGLYKGDHLREIGHMGLLVFVVYEKSENTPAYASMCDDGDEFFVSAYEFNVWIDKTARI